MPIRASRRAKKTVLRWNPHLKGERKSKEDWKVYKDSMGQDIDYYSRNWMPVQDDIDESYYGYDGAGFEGWA
jgi:hypothetical protein